MTKKQLQYLILSLFMAQCFSIQAQTAFIPPAGAQRGSDVAAAPVAPVSVSKIENAKSSAPSQAQNIAPSQAQNIAPSQALAQNLAKQNPAPLPAQGQGLVSNNYPPVVNQALQPKTINEYGKLTRASGNNQIQKAWDDAKGTDGVFVYEWCDICTYKIATREFFITNIELPKDEVIETIDVGDNSAFQIKQRSPFSISIKPLLPNIDSNILVFTAKKNIYPFYVRAEGINSPNIPDMLVRINAPVELNNIKKSGRVNVQDDNKMQIIDKTTAQKLALSDRLSNNQENSSVKQKPLELNFNKKYPQEAKFDPSKIRGWEDYTLKGDSELKPEAVFRDDFFTYINFGKKFNEIDLPVAFVVNDGIDENVNSRVLGTTLIIESTAKTITLISGKKFLCVKYEGK